MIVQQSFKCLIKPLQSSRCQSKIHQAWKSTHTLKQQQQRCYATRFGYSIAKCLVFEKHGKPADVLRLHTHSISPAHGDEITVKFLASPINPADINQIEGTYPAKPNFTTGLGTEQACAVSGNEGLVQIISCGSRADTALKVGDWAIMSASRFGTWRTYATVTSGDLLKIQDHDGVTIQQAATVSVNPCTAYRMLKDFTALSSGDWFIQNAANSGVGRMAIQLGRIWGYKSINIVRDRPELKVLKEELMSLGATLVVTEEELAGRDIRDMIFDATRGASIKLGLNAVGGQATTNLVKQLSSGAHLVTYGAMSKKPVILAAGSFIFRDLHAHGMWISTWSDANPNEKVTMVNEILDLYRKGQLKDGPINVIEWSDDTPLSTLLEGVEGGISEFSKGKGIFIMKDT